MFVVNCQKKYCSTFFNRMKKYIFFYGKKTSVSNTTTCNDKRFLENNHKNAKISAVKVSYYVVLHNHITN